MIEVLDAFDGLMSLTRRSATLDGSIPLRAARACVPLLEGNAFGFQLRLKKALTIERRLGRGPRVVGDDRMRSAMPRLVAHGYIRAGSRWHRAFADGIVHAHRNTLYLFTGLLVRASTVLRLSATANRRSHLFDVDEVLIGEGELVPLVVPIKPLQSGPLHLDGEIATLAELTLDVPIEREPLRDAKELGEAHVDFYDEAYFSDKKADSTRKYRALEWDNECDDGPTRVVDAGPVSVSIERRDRFLTATSVLPERRKEGVSVIAFETLLPFEATFDGSALVVRYDEPRLAREVRALEKTWSDTFGDAFCKKHKRALWYLTKYFTPHPRGEPHFFVKPWAFVQTPRGWSSLIEGTMGDGFEIMRGVIASDVFHAAPAVFRVHRIGTVKVREGQRLLEVIPFRRDQKPRVRELAWPDA